jgi:hypothetical protein
MTAAGQWTSQPFGTEAMPTDKAVGSNNRLKQAARGRPAAESRLRSRAAA